MFLKNGNVNILYTEFDMIVNIVENLYYGWCRMHNHAHIYMEIIIDYG